MKESELELWKRHRQGDEAAREELILMYAYLVKHFVKKLCRVAYWAICEDLMQEGAKGLIKAVDGRFDPNEGRSFEAYSRKYIRGAVLRSPEFSQNLSRHQGELYRWVREAHDKLMQKLERKPTLEEIADETGLTVKQINNAIDAMSIAFTDEMPDDYMLSATTATTVEQPYRTALIKEALSRLSDRDAMILIDYYSHGELDREIAEKLGIKAGTVSKARKRAIIKLRAQLEVEERKRRP